MFKSKLGLLLDMFAKLSTTIFVFSSIYIAIFNGVRVSLSISYIWGVLALALVLTLVYAPFITEKEVSKKRFLIYNICYFVFADLVVLLFGFLLKWFSFEHPLSIMAMELTFVVVFIVVHLIMYFSAKSTADKMNEQLKKLKES